MNVITVTREFGAGGYEVANRLADLLGWQLLDRQQLHRAAALEDLHDAELAHVAENALSPAERLRHHPQHERYLHTLQEAARQAAAKGNVVLVGRGTRQVLGEAPGTLHVRLAAPLEWRAGRMTALESWPYEQALARCVEEDRVRDRYLRYLFSEEELQLWSYDFVANTGRVSLEDVVAAVVALIRGDWQTEAPTGSSAPRVLTLSRELGAGGTDSAPTLGARLGLRVCDRELIEQEAVRMGVAEAELEQIDEHLGGDAQDTGPGSLYQRYFAALGQLMIELADQGDVLLVGRGGNRFLQNHPRAFHARLVAPLDVRVLRVMEHRWLKDEQARKLIAESDQERRAFYQSYFGADWSSPLEHHITVNSGRLGSAAVDLVAFAAGRYWARGRE